MPPLGVRALAARLPEVGRLAGRWARRRASARMPARSSLA